MISMKQYVNLVFFAILVLGLSACGPPSGGLSMALNLQENDSYKMELELREIIEQDFLDNESVEIIINKWDLSFRVQFVEDEKIGIEVSVDAVSLIKEGIDKLLSQKQMQILSGQIFSFEIDRQGRVLAISGLDEIESYFIENFDLVHLVEELSGGRLQVFGESEDEIETNEHLSDMIESAREGYQPIISMAFDMLLGEELMHDLLSNVFAANNDKSLMQGMTWDSDRVVSRSYSTRQPATSSMKLESLGNNSVSVEITSQSFTNKPHSFSDTNALLSGLGMDIHLIEVHSNGEGEIHIDSDSGWPQRGRLDIESEGIATFDFSSEWIGIMQVSSDKSASEIEADLEKLKSNPFKGEVTFEFSTRD